MIEDQKKRRIFGAIILLFFQIAIFMRIVCTKTSQNQKNSSSDRFSIQNSNKNNSRMCALADKSNIIIAAVAIVVGAVMCLCKANSILFPRLVLCLSHSHSIGFVMQTCTNLMATVHRQQISKSQVVHMV